MAKKLYKYRIIGVIRGVSGHLKYKLRLDMGKRIEEGRAARKKEPVEKEISRIRLIEYYNNGQIVGYIPDTIRSQIGIERRKKKMFKINPEGVDIVW